jgi:hypothetical protein
MGLFCSNASLQRLMEKLMNRINYVIVYINDFLIHSQTHKHHLKTLEANSKRLEENNKKVNLLKCLFGSLELSYHGSSLKPEGNKSGKN